MENNNTDIQAEIPQPTRTESTVWPSSGYDAYDIIVLTTTLLPSGDVIISGYRVGSKQRRI
jgi:hypothetical protein